MAALMEGTVGILPAGALGVSFFYHLTRQLSHINGEVFFMERAGSASSESLRARGEIIIADSRQRHHVPTGRILKADLLTCHQQGCLPEVLLVCPNPDQLLTILTHCVELLEKIYEKGELWGGALPIPYIVLSSNGIYFQRLRQIFIEKIEEATLLGRLPDLWPNIMPQIVGRLLRGITIQTGIREGSGGDCIYRPGPKGITRLAGGDTVSRERCCRVLAEKGGWFELAPNSSATRLEFDKAILNLSTNLLGQLYAIDEAGQFRLLSIDEIVVPEHKAEIRELALQVFRVGQAVKAYGRTESFEAVLDRAKEILHLHRSHIPSSLQWVALRLRQKKLEPALTPTETWLLDPLIRYARSAGLEEAERYFEGLRGRLLAKLTLASQGHQPVPAQWEI